MSADDGANNNANNPARMLMCMYKGPGPAVYNLKTLIGAYDHCKSKPQAPAFTIGRPYKWNFSDSPGPAYNYDANLTVYGQQKTPAATITSRPRTKGVEVLPGPGAYDAKTADTGRRVTIGFPVRSPFKNDAPPPNVYHIKSGIGTRTTHEPTTPAFGVRSRSFVGSPYYTGVKSAVPGPAAYDVPENRRIFPNSGGPFTIKSRTPYNDPIGKVKDGPGPGTYHPGQSAPCGNGRGFSMGVRHSPYIMPLITAHDMAY